jgi:hypothetical protein
MIIQEEIDAIFASGSTSTKTIFIPGGRYACALPIYLDPPHNMRGIGRRPDWSETTEYVKGDVILDQGIPWVSQVDGNLGNKPILPPTCTGGLVGAGLKFQFDKAGNFPRPVGSQHWVTTTNTLGTPDSDPTSWMQAIVYWRPYLDPNPVDFAFSLSLIGEEGLSQYGWGTQFDFAFHDTCALVVGPGNGMMVKGITAIHLGVADAQSYRGCQPMDGVGIGICDGNGGSSRTLVEKCMVQGFYRLYTTGVNHNGNLGDSNELRDSFLWNGYIGAEFADTQNFICSLYNMNVGATIGVKATANTGANVFNGNYSGDEGAQRKAFSISNVSAATQVGEQITFTATVANPDFFLPLGCYNSMAIVTTHFGVVPLVMTAFDEVTSKITLATYENWNGIVAGNGSTIILSNSRFAADLQAATTLYAVERQTQFWGGAIGVDNVHVESANACMTLIDSSAGWGNQQPNMMTNVHINYDPSLTGLAPQRNSNPDDNAAFFCQQSWPFIRVNDIDLVFDNTSFSNSINSGQQSFNVDIYKANLDVRHTVQTNSWNLRCSFQSGVGFTDYRNNYTSPLMGRGSYDRDMFRAAIESHPVDWLSHPFTGLAPARWCSPPLNKVDVAALSGPLPPLVAGRGATYPLMWGGRPYTVIADFAVDYLTPPVKSTVWSSHAFYTYGQGLPGSWSYKGGSWCVYMDAGLLSRMRPGLGIILNGALCMVRTVHTWVGNGTLPGHVTVVNTTGGDYGPILLPGNIDAVYTGTVLAQQPFSLVPL